MAAISHSTASAVMRTEVLQAPPHAVFESSARDVRTEIVICAIPGEELLGQTTVRGGKSNREQDSHEM